jgi:outer membrane protein OmpA-like peptidoglycan-associated protein
VLFSRCGAAVVSVVVLGLMGSSVPTVMAAEALDADALARRLGGFTPRAGPGTTIEDEWSRPDLSCTPVAARGAFHAEGERVIRRPRVELEINFAFGSAELLADSIGQLAALAEAMTRDRLKDQRFLLLGHTDAVGSEDANQALSAARAAAVRRYLSEVQGIAPERLEARGCGERRLVDESDPESPKNRRVEVVNAGP